MTIDDDGTCQELVELVTDYLEGALNEGERERIERHLAGCTGCRHYLTQMQLTIAAAARPAPETIPEPVRARLLAAFRAAREEG